MSISLDLLKKNKKIIIIYRNNENVEQYTKIYAFRKKCKVKNFKFYIANNYELAKSCNADGLYLSAYNKKIYPLYGSSLIGSAHNFKEIYEKIKQGCSTIILSRLFKTDYNDKKGHLGPIKFNLLISKYKIAIIPLGGIKDSNLNKLNLVNSSGLALFSEIKKKPDITTRLF